MNFELAKKKLYANRANIAFVGGTALTMIGTGLFIRAARKNTPVIEAHKADMKELTENDNDEKRAICIRTVKESTKNYALPVVVSGTGYALQIYSNQTHNKELALVNTMLTAATASYEMLKEKINEKYGADAWAELNGLKVSETVDPETGEVSKSVEYDSNGEYSYFKVFFDELNPNFSNRPGDNRRFILLKLKQAQMDLANVKVITYLDLLTHYLGYSISQLSEQFQQGVLDVWSRAGWYYGKESDPTVFIDAGLYRHDEATERFMQDLESNVLLEFNPHPNVFALLKK